MSNERDEFYEDNDFFEAYRSFKNSVHSGNVQYFDVVEFEEIIDTLIDEMDYENAAIAIHQALEVHPGAFPIRLRSAQLNIHNKEPEKALPELEALKEIDQFNPDLFLMLGTALLMVNEPAKAENNFLDAIHYAEDELDEILYHIGSSYISIGNLEKAIGYFERSFKENAENELVLNDLGYFYDQLGDSAKSIHYYNLYLDQDPFNPAVWFNLGIAYNRSLQFDKAIEAYDYTLVLDETFYYAIFNKANSLANLEKYKEAIAAYRLYLKYDKTNDDALCYMGECYLNQGRFRLAERYYQHALKINPDNDIALFSSGIICWIELRFEQSIKLIRRAIEIEKSTPDYWFTFARVLSDSGHRFEALSAYKKAAHLSPLNPEVWINFAELQHKLGMVKEAISTLKKGIRFNNNDAVIKYLLAAYLLETNEEKEATIQLETALKLDFSHHDDLFRFYPKAAHYDSVKKLIKNYNPLK